MLFFIEFVRTFLCAAVVNFILGFEYWTDEGWDKKIFQRIILLFFVGNRIEFVKPQSRGLHKALDRADELFDNGNTS